MNGKKERRREGGRGGERERGRWKNVSGVPMSKKRREVDSWGWPLRDY